MGIQIIITFTQDLPFKTFIDQLSRELIYYATLAWFFMWISISITHTYKIVLNQAYKRIEHFLMTYM